MTAPTTALAASVRAGSGENAYKCYQCKRCSTGCPVAGYANLHPAQIMRAVQLGLVDDVLASKFIWLCTGCETCTTRCPQSIDIAAIMDELKIIARRAGRVRKNAPFANILDLNFKSMKRWGRLYEAELIMRDKVTRPSGMMDDVLMGLKMFAKGKIKVLPARGDTAQMKRMVAAAEQIAAERAAKCAADHAAECAAAPGDAK
jgi:heterodisulfide reductase subunit C